jgi:phosphopantothenoylcysteine synthetase/decarboxylase
MRVVITCGPAMAPIDAVRRITNFSTGELGVRLANACAAAGHEVLCFKGEAATTTLPPGDGVAWQIFTTNDDLAAKLADVGGAAAVFHAAALCDYEVARVRNEYGEILDAAKIPSREGELHLELKPARKLLPELPAMFPGARIVGWKYELVGALADALHAAAHQLEDCGTEYCVVNGAAYGAGFGLVDRRARVRHFVDKAALCDGLVALIGGSLS